MIAIVSTLLSAHIQIYVHVAEVLRPLVSPPTAYMQWRAVSSVRLGESATWQTWAKVLLLLPDIAGDKRNLTSLQCAYIFYAYEYERETAATTTPTVIH